MSSYILRQKKFLHHPLKSPFRTRKSIEINTSYSSIIVSTIARSTLCLEYRQWSRTSMALLSSSGVDTGFREAYRWV